MFHKEMKRKFMKNPFLPANMFYNEENDYYVCPMGQHLEHIRNMKSTTDTWFDKVLYICHIKKHN